MATRRPLVGITANERIRHDGTVVFELKAAYTDALRLAGALPVVLPYATAEVVGQYLGRLDGLVLSGGADVPAKAQGLEEHAACHYLTETRWNSERIWYESARDARLPVLGICLGMQVMCVCEGGRLAQDIEGHRAPKPDDVTGCPRVDPDVVHRIAVEPGSLLATLIQAQELDVVSCHHQAVDVMPDAFDVGARAGDGVIEAIAPRTRAGFVLGVQWHPERAQHQPDWLLGAFVARCGRKEN